MNEYNILTQIYSTRSNENLSCWLMVLCDGLATCARLLVNSRWDKLHLLVTRNRMDGFVFSCDENKLSAIGFNPIFFCIPILVPPYLHTLVLHPVMMIDTSVNVCIFCLIVYGLEGTEVCSRLNYLLVG